MLTIDDLDEAVRIFHHPPRHGELAGQCLALPDWLDPSIAPDSPAFRDQQMRFWREITRRDRYDPFSDEDTPEIAGLDALHRPAFYASGDAYEAGRHLLAMGHILMRSGVRAGDRVIEYGAGFGQNALTLARLGAQVDTVDIAEGFCGAVTAQAARFDVDLTAWQAPFGFNPAGRDGAYDLILFYESFHHCLEFADVIPRLAAMLKPGGRILLSGEPIVRHPHPLMPYPWGIRLDWENVAVMRLRGWMELGFREDFLVRHFLNAGLTWRLWPEPLAHNAQVYEFRRWNEPIRLGDQTLTVEEEAGWHGAEPDGRWTRGRATLGLPAHDGPVVVTMIGRGETVRAGTARLGGCSRRFTVAPGETIGVTLDGAGHGATLAIEYEGGMADDPGLFVRDVMPA